MDSFALSAPNVKKYSLKKYISIVCLAFMLLFINTSLEILNVYSLKNNLKPHNNASNNHYNHTQWEIPVSNNTMCAYMKQFRLSERRRITICHMYPHQFRIDIRRFIGTKPTIQGIWLNKQEWNVMLMLWGKIQSVVNAHQ